MDFVDISINEDIAIVSLSRPKVNAINEQVTDELHRAFNDLADVTDVRAIILTAKGNFFSFGFDVPEFLSYPKDSFTRFVISFVDLINYIFVYPKPVVAALNGHTIAGGTLIALACDYRLMVSGKAKIALNEITFGSTIFINGIELLKFWVGEKNTESILFSGKMYEPPDALELGLIHEVISNEVLMDESLKRAKDLSIKDLIAYKSMKLELREGLIDRIKHREKESINGFVDIWYSEGTRRKLERIEIRN